MCCGDRREAIFADDGDREMFLGTLAPDKGPVPLCYVPDGTRTFVKATAKPLNLPLGTRVKIA